MKHNGTGSAKGQKTNLKARVSSSSSGMIVSNNGRKGAIVTTTEQNDLIDRDGHRAHCASSRKTIPQISQRLDVAAPQRWFVIDFALQPFLIKIHHIRGSKSAIFLQAPELGAYKFCCERQ